MSESIYSGVQQARNGTEIPVFTNGRTFFSSYNPERDAENFVTAHKDAFDGAGCILTGGIGNGLHILKLSEQYPDSQIIAFEADDASLAFSRSHLISALSEKLNDSGCRITLTSIENLSQILPVKYVPALHGNFTFAAVRSWTDFLGERAASFIPLINGIINDISADYSVQAQFGKLWHRNILLNLSLFESMHKEQVFNYHTFTPKAKKAAIIGAGPSLDKSILTLAKERSEYCIFATDTTFSTLKSAGITPDFVVTVDSQHVSEKHFVGQSLEGTVLAADLTANSSIIQHALESETTVLLFHNSHPLSLLIDSWLSDIKGIESPFPIIDSGAGTVLHAATDLARRLGFEKLTFFGADFAYSEGKSYTKGTYLEKQYYTEDDRTGNAETAYSQLMYRTPLIQLEKGSSTTEVLSRYKNALETYLVKNIPDSLTDASSDENSWEKQSNSINLTDFIPWYVEKLQKKDKKVLFSVLPLAAWYKKNFPDADTECVYAFAEQQTANVGRIQCHLQKK